MPAAITESEAALRTHLASRHHAMLDDLRHAVDTPTGPGSGAGLASLRAWFESRLVKLNAACEHVPGQPKASWLQGDAEGSEIPPLLIARHAAPGPRLLLCGHLDTVHPASSPFRSFALSADGATITGPGCVDMKGGLIVALHALEALAACGHRVAWTFMLNSDEETGSYHSDAAMRAEAAKGYAAGLVFEPAMANGGLVTQRPGSGQFMIETRGKSGHVGRDFASCVSAVTPLARCILAASAMARPEQGAIVNIGPIRGGIATNVVPDSAAAWGNVRFETPEIAAELGASLDALATSPDAMPSIAVHRSFQRPAKPCTPAVERLALAARAAAESLGQSLPFGKTGGVCDGNNLQAAGLPVIDTLGVRGGGLHTTDEWVEARSLVERAQLVAVLLSRLARGGVDAA